MPKIHLNNGGSLEVSTFKVEAAGIVYQVAPIGSAMPHSSMGFIRIENIDCITHDEMVIIEADVTNDTIQP